MKINIENYRFTSKRLTGDNLKLFFVNIKDANEVKILELLNIAAFIEDEGINESNFINISDKCGVYGMDISMKLKRPEINNYQEVFIYKDEKVFNSSFRAISEKIVWRNFDKSSIDDINYY